MQYELTPLQESDIPALARLHSEIFPDSRSTQLGQMYVRKMFKWFYIKQPQLCFVAKQGNALVGYVVGAVGGYGRRLFRYAIFEIIAGLVFRPRLWVKKETFSLWQSYMKGLLPNRKPSQTSLANQKGQILSAALAGIGVDPKMRGMGVGKALVLEFENAARSLQVGKLTLSVHLDNHSACRLYESCGWVMDNEDIDRNSAHYCKII